MVVHRAEVDHSICHCRRGSDFIPRQGAPDLGAGASAERIHVGVIGSDIERPPAVKFRGAWHRRNTGISCPGPWPGTGKPCLSGKFRTVPDDFIYLMSGIYLITRKP